LYSRFVVHKQFLKLLKRFNTAFRATLPVRQRITLAGGWTSARRNPVRQSSNRPRKFLYGVNKVFLNVLSLFPTGFFKSEIIFVGFRNLSKAVVSEAIFESDILEASLIPYFFLVLLFAPRFSIRDENTPLNSNLFCRKLKIAGLHCGCYICQSDLNQVLF